MRRSIAAWAAAGGAVVLALVADRPSVEGRAASRDLESRSVLPVRPRLPLAFEENRGQTDERVRFVVHGRGMTTFLCPTETVFSLPAGAERTDVVRMRFAESNPAPKVEGRGALPGRTNHFIGNDPSKWITNAPTFAGAVVRDVYAGVDLVWRSDDDGRSTYDLTVAPGADVGSIAFSLDGALSLDVAADGSLRAATASGELRQTRPVAWQIVDGRRRAVDVAFAATADRVRFDVGAHDRSLPLVVDPSVTFATYLGGNQGEALYEGAGVAVDSTGATYVVGQTQSSDFPTVSPIQGNGTNSPDVFVAKIAPSGNSLLWSTYLGGSSFDFASSIAVDGAGNAYVGGHTGSPNFPTAAAFQNLNAGSFDVFIAKIAASGQSLLYSTYFGGPANEFAYGTAVDSLGGVYVVGETTGGIPIASAAQSVYGGSTDAFVVKLAPGGAQKAYATYVGGSGADRAHAVAVDASGAAYVTGQTNSTNFPLQSAFQSAAGGNYDAFVTKLAPNGASFVYSTRLGGSGSEYGYGIAVDAAGAAYVAGTTTSADFPTAAALQAANAGGSDAFVTVLAPSGTALAWSTYLGGIGNETARGVAVDWTGAATVVGDTFSPDFPLSSPSQAAAGAGFSDAFVSRFAVGGGLAFSTYLGGAGHDVAHAVAADASGDVRVAGYTDSANLPVVAALQPTMAGPADAFVAKYPIGGGAPVPVPRAPTNLVAVYTKGTGVALSWTDSSDDETGFRVERKVNSYPYQFLTTTVASEKTTTDTHLYAAVTFTYRVCAFNVGGKSAWSNEATITTDPGESIVAQPVAPTQLTATPLLDGRIGLAWSDGSPDEVGFEIERATGGLAPKHFGDTRADVTSEIDADVHPGWPYWYSVRSLSPQGASAWCAPAVATMPATVYFVLESGALTASPKRKRSSVKIVAGYELSWWASELVFEPVARGLELQLGFAGAPATVSIAPNDARWKVKRTRATKTKPSVTTRARWTSPKGATPKATIVVDLLRHRITATLTAFDFAPGAAAPIRTLVGSGPDGGAHVVDWTQTKPGKFRYVKPK